MSDRPAKIAVNSLSKTFGGQLVLDELDLSVADGGTTVILGKSGEGKSVLLKHLIGLLRPDSGNVLYDGVDIYSLDSEGLGKLRRSIGMVFQDAALFDDLNVFENVAFPLYEHTQLLDGEIEQRVLQKLELVGLAEDWAKFPSQLSGGMRKRVGLARALIFDPQVVLYDEPTTGLDPIIGDQITDLMLNMQESLHLTSVVISHNLSTSFRIADKIALLSGGKIAVCGTVDEFRRSSHPVVQEFMSKGSVS